MNQQITTMTPESLNQNNRINYFIRNSLMLFNTSYVAEIVKVDGLLASIKPMLNNVGTGQQSQELPVIDNIPISIDGNKFGVIDPNYQIGDIVLCVVIQRDITNLKKQWKQRANPPSNRIANYADSIIVKNLTNALPSTIFKFTENGIEITTNKKITLTANNTIVNGDVELGGSGGAKVLTENTIITAPNGTCTISNPAEKVKAL